MSRLEYRMYINGEWVESSSGETFEDLNPYDESVYAVVPRGTREDAKSAVDSAYEAFDRWSEISPSERARYILKLYDVLERKKDEIVNVLIKESGSTVRKAYFEAAIFVPEMILTAAEEAKRVEGEILPSSENKISLVVKRPEGVIAAITPFNFPFLLSMKKVLFALAAGNTVVLKPSEDTPVTGVKIAELFDEAGFPKGVVNVVTGFGEDVGDELVVNEKVSHVTFTGSTETGRIIAEKAGRKLKKVTLELGGSDPLIILKDAKVDRAVKAAVFGAFFHQGQICMSSKRIIVEEEIADEFVRRFTERVKKLVVGDPADPKTDIGPIINWEQLNKLKAQLEDALEKGAKILCGGRHERLLFYPTLLDNVTLDMKVMKEEVFGPLRPIVIVSNAEEAVEIANSTEYGLSAGIITSNIERGLEIAKRLETGMVHINDSSVFDEPWAPFGGVKCSGIGREGGKYSIQEMTVTRWITIQMGEKDYPI